MINISYILKNEKVIFLKASGHADFAIEGSDIVCSAVSAVIVGGLNALENQDQFDINVEKGLVELNVKKETSIHDEIVLNTIITQLRSIEENYGKFIKIQKKGCASK